jgi:hypothetical protein
MYCAHLQFQNCLVYGNLSQNVASRRVLSFYKSGMPRFVKCTQLRSHDNPLLRKFQTKFKTQFEGSYLDFPAAYRARQAARHRT